MRTSQRRLFINEFALRIVAMVLMTLDHIGVFVLLKDGNSVVGDVFRYSGRLALPLFMFMVAEGVIHTKSKKNYLLRLGILMVSVGIAMVALSSIPYFKNALGIDPFRLTNPFIDIFIAAATLILLSLKGPKKLLAIIPIGFALLSHGVNAYEANTNYTINWLPLCFRDSTGAYGLLIALGFYFSPAIVDSLSRKSLEEDGIGQEIWKESPQRQGICNLFGCALFLVVTLVIWGLSYTPVKLDGQVMNMGIMTYGLISMLLIYFYNGKRGYDSKGFRWFCYLYFPLHIVLLFVIFTLI